MKSKTTKETASSTESTDIAPLSSLRLMQPLSDPLSLIWALDPHVSDTDQARLLSMARKTYITMMNRAHLTIREYNKLMNYARFALKENYYNEPEVQQFLMGRLKSFNTAKWKRRYVRNVAADPEAHSGSEKT